MRRAIAVALLASVTCACLSSEAAEQAEPARPAKPTQDAGPQRPSVFDLPKIRGQYVQMQIAASAHIRAGDYASAEKLCRESVALVPHGFPGHYNLACALARQGKTTDALDSLAQAVALGFRDAAKIQVDQDLESLRGEDRFAEIVEQASKAKGKPEDPWRRAVTPRQIENGVALVGEDNTVWDARLNVFQSLFKFASKPAENAEVVLEHGEVGRALRMQFKGISHQRVVDMIDQCID